MSKLLVLPSNPDGRDFICSDIHGHFALLEQKLASVNFNPKLDRVLALGDLIDRGPSSLLAFEYLSKSWFYSIIGNHEVMLIDSISDEKIKRNWQACGGDWSAYVSDEQLNHFSELLKELPIAIEVPVSASSSIGLVHANLPQSCDWNDVRSLLNKFPTSSLPDNPLIHEMLWSKISSEKETQLQDVENIAHVFHGHTIKPEIMTFANRTYMDIGSYATGDIALVELAEFLKSIEIN